MPHNAALIGWGGDNSTIGPVFFLFSPVQSFTAPKGADFVIGYVTIFQGASRPYDDVHSFRLGINPGASDPLYAGPSYLPVSVSGSNYNIGGQLISATFGTWGTIELLGRFNSPLAFTGFGSNVDLSFLPDGTVSASPTRSTNIAVVPVPEPSTYGLFVSAVLFGIIAVSRRLKRTS